MRKYKKYQRKTKDEIVLIKLALMSGESYSEIQKKVDISTPCISDIVHLRSHNEIVIPGFEEAMRRRLQEPQHVQARKNFEARKGATKK